jgi:hypothetical protein
MRIRKALAAVTAVLIGVVLVPTAAPAMAAASDEFIAPVDIAGTQNLGTFYLRNAGAQKCLDAPENRGGANNTPVDLWDCNNGPMLRWTLYYNRNYSYPYWLVNSHFWGQCLDYPASSGGANGKRYNVYGCLNTPGQMFRISGYNAQVGGRLLAVQLGGPNNHMDAFANGGTGNGRPVGNWAWTGHALQHWYFDRV